LAVRVPGPLGASRGRGLRAVLAVLAAGRATCLERSVVLQAWLAAAGREHAVVVGIRPGARFTAHAWVEGLEADAGYVEIARVPPR
jgi:hypothetical protein